MKTIKKYFVLVFILSFTVSAQQLINLYTDSIPNSKESTAVENYKAGMYSNVTKPTMEFYKPVEDKFTGTAVVICPGGGYSVVVYDAEGVTTAKEFAKNGIAAFVLKYRLPTDSTMIDKKIGPLQDAQRAIKIVRDNSEKWGIDKNKIGIMGFSAGGHLASTAATHYTKPVVETNGTNVRPDFQILVYPVISMQDSLTHLGSRNNLLGENPSKEMIDLFSNELQVNENTPPAYLTHSGDDTVVDVDNSIEYYEALRHNDVSAEMHLYPHGNHGFVLKLPTTEWVAPIINWMNSIHLNGK